MKSRPFAVFILYIFQSGNSYNFVYFTIDGKMLVNLRVTKHSHNRRAGSQF